MKFKKTLVSLVAPVILAGSALFPQNSYSEIRSPQKVTPQTIQLSERNPRFAGQVNMELYNRTLTGNKDIKYGNMPIYLEGEWNKEKGKLYFSYTAGRMTDEGPLLNQSSIKKARNLPLESIPKFDDPETEIYIISTTKDLDVGDITQKAFIHNARTNPLELKPLEEHKVGALAWWGLNKGYDWAMKKGDEMVIDYVSGGITKVVPYFGELPSKVQDKIIEKIPKPFEETKKFFDRRAQRMKEEGERDALSSLENAVYVQQFPLFPTFKNQVAKSFEVDLRNNSFDDEQVSIWIRNLSVGNKSNYGLLHGNVGDISMVVDLPSRVNYNDFKGRWKLKEYIEEGVNKGNGPDEIQIAIGKDGPLFEVNSEKTKIEMLKFILDSKTIGFREKNEDEIGIFRSISSDLLWMTQSSLERLNKGDLRYLDRQFEKDRVVFTRTKLENNRSSSGIENIAGEVISGDREIESFFKKNYEGHIGTWIVQNEDMEELSLETFLSKGEKVFLNPPNIKVKSPGTAIFFNDKEDNYHYKISKIIPLTKDILSFEVQGKTKYFMFLDLTSTKNIHVSPMHPYTYINDYQKLFNRKKEDERIMYLRLIGDLDEMVFNRWGKLRLEKE